MVTESNSIATLREYYGDRLHVGDQADLMAELMDGNDRSAIITVAALCDSCLEVRIASALPELQSGTKKAFEEAFRHDGAIGTFSAKISIAFYMGLIDERLRKQLNDLRSIRNSVAHTRRRVTFNDIQLQNAIRRLLNPAGMYALLNDTPDGFLRSFIAEGLFIVAAIHEGRVAAVEKTRASFVDAGCAPPF